MIARGVDQSFRSLQVTTLDVLGNCDAKQKGISEGRFSAFAVLLLQKDPAMIPKITRAATCIHWAQKDHE